MDSERATIEPEAPVRSGHKSSHMTARPQRIEVITRGERRRQWSVEAKREIVAESLQAGVRPSEIIHKHGITSGQLYAWRQQLARRVDGALARPAAAFARIDVIAEVPKAAAVKKPPAQVPALAAPRARGLIEIVLPGGTLVRVDAHVDDRALRCVLGVLHER